MVEKVHEHGSLAGIQLCHNGSHGANLYGRLAPMTVGHMPVSGNDPVQARRMDIADIDDLRRRHRAAVRRSLSAGFDLVYVYAGHGLNAIGQFLDPRLNQRTDGYGGAVANRARLLREVLEDTVDEVAGRAAVACRIMVDGLLGDDGFGRSDIEAVLDLVGEVPDLWDFQVGEWENDSVTSRFAEEGAQEAYVRGLKQLTSKPVVGVGRFTSPDTMARMVRDGVLDLIGAARPSIADPFLPTKIEEGRYEDICECIGCNICVSGDATMTPIRCTQNPTMGEEWRRGWHPERIRARTTDAKVLVVGAGPAGLEAARALGKRGYDVVLAEATRSLGGRVALEARLPGLAAWIRVLDYRASQIERLPNVEVALESRVTADEILAYDFQHVAIATGARWRRDGAGRWHPNGLPVAGDADVLTPDDLLAGRRPRGDRVVLFDDDHYYIGGVLAELLIRESLRRHARDAGRAGLRMDRQHDGAGAHPTPPPGARGRDPDVRDGRCASMTASRARRASTPEVRPSSNATPSCSSRHACRRMCCTHRCTAGSDAWRDAGIVSVRALGDAWSPGTIAAAVWDGRRYAEELDGPDRGDAVPFLREVVSLAP